MRKRGRKRVSREARIPLAAPSGPNRLWSLDFVADSLSWGRKIRMLTVVDAFSRESLAIEVDTSLPGVRVARVLDRIVGERGAPEAISLGNGPELTSRGARPVGLPPRRQTALHRPRQAPAERVH